MFNRKRNILLKFKATDEVLKDFGYEDIKDKVVRKEKIVFHKFSDTPEYEKEVPTVIKSFDFDSYKEINERLKYLSKHNLYSIIISDNNPDSEKSKTFGKIYTIKETGMNLEFFLKEYIQKEFEQYEVVRTKSGSKNDLKRVHYWRREI